MSTDDSGAADRLPDVRYYTVGGQLIAGGKTELTSGTIRYVMGVAYGGPKIDGGFVWTGTLENGQVSSGATCTSWTTDAGTGTTGQIGVRTSAWTNATATPCATPGGRLLCFGVR